MKFEPGEDLSAFLAALERLALMRETGWQVAANHARYALSAPLDTQLEDNGFFDCAAEPSLGLTAAAAMTARLAALPVLVECAASSMLRGRFCPDLPRPLAVVEGDERAAIRFLPVARSVLALGHDGIRVATLGNDAVATVDSLFAYPMGVLNAGAVDWHPLDVDAAAVRNAWRVAIAAEISGALKGGLDAVVAHVRERRQFGRPLGSFQALQHRLAAATTKIDAAYWLALKAAQTLKAVDAATALGYAQDISTKVVYDLHQFMGAMGLTLEHPLHRWTYRVRLLRSALGGASAHFAAVADHRWRAA